MRPRWEIRDSTDGQVYAVLRAANGEVVATTETVPDERTCRRSIAAVRRAAFASVLRVGRPR